MFHPGKGEHVLQTGSAVVGQVSTEEPLSLGWMQDPTGAPRVRPVWGWLVPDLMQPWVSVLHISSAHLHAASVA